MPELILVGASGLAREALALIAAAGRHRPVAVVDDGAARWGSELAGVPVIGGLDAVHQHPRAEIVVCVGHGSARARLVDRLRAVGVVDSRYARLVHPGVHVPDDCRIGAGSILFAGVVLTADVSLGRHVVAMPNVTLTHGNRIGSFATLCAGVTLGGGVRVGEEAYLGMSASVRERARIGRRATLGMGAVLLRDQPAGETWIGVPAAARPGPAPLSRAGTTLEGASA
ncbi:sugar O-acyltransferase, sialic acid O-acetyltransferase NeuD family [Rathayibacter oskolensis]|uniref:Sugar O-acyltransferase, sialic acid O-acetyltransferase NeuD family n=1 Tax=Rathayibacter oskolensis TaxID=1891671 RepID=A0A1X7NR11_9MICO|nr:NeuD/PglB/VioB family sugar acetyltransferase [Rathayibacter oskolensis]SMH39599.1 sugar O-acyltransferase, sialic acid O-acetyltransferase NeuD family [Rathayibacter oskolensis]